MCFTGEKNKDALFVLGPWPSHLSQRDGLGGEKMSVT